MRSFTVRFADGVVMVIEACDEPDARRTAAELREGSDVIDVQEAAMDAAAE